MLRSFARSFRPCKKLQQYQSTALFSTGAGGKILSPPMVYIKGEEMTRYCMSLILDHWIEPHIDTKDWEVFDLSCVSRDQTEDKVLEDAVQAGARIGSIFKEPTVTPTEIQKEELGLKRTWNSPNGAMRRGWNGITISRDTIHIEGMELGFERPVVFERHAVGGEYGAGYKMVGKGTIKTTYTSKEDGQQIEIDSREITDDLAAVVTYHNPLDNVNDLADIFYERCLEKHVTPYIVTKKTVFKWQEDFWRIMKEVFDAKYKDRFLRKGLLDSCGGELQHLISDAATMQIIRWTKGGFGMACHNYDGDMLTDEVAQVHRSPGFITSNLTGKRDDGALIKEFEASHGTVSDMWHAHLRNEETSINPLGMVEALIGALQHGASLAPNRDSVKLVKFTNKIRDVVHRLMVTGRGTRDLCGSSGLTTEEFVDTVAQVLDGTQDLEFPTERKRPVDDKNVDAEAMRAMFEDLDLDGNGSIDFEEFSAGLRKLGIQPRKMGF